LEYYQGRELLIDNATQIKGALPIDARL